MRVNKWLTEKLKKLPPIELNGQLFELNGCVYVSILAYYTGERKYDVNTTTFLLINLDTFGRWKNPSPLGVLIEDFIEYEFNYLGRTENLANMTLAFPKDLSLIEEYHKQDQDI